ncbi:glucitol operon activator [Clostridium pasteurianum DSM 525 = ATCC 6013]|uniref:Glucitol operon activator n=1 Tax=Clostridium pasteurianum DSM 525 = ATCC 6013 TaxID=1262449 RepID=A0A0H3J650_CLOPA|nr:transcriptional regulator GutM [Clostridium pasteurianum]AJA48944.1 glucitol operon activator [Clostridium pasteurianum DSM 525 = ATCC 6013]AJA52932.1 glucitol operon activator [Clostridium pasteurianum DSM 525 = ATCC 6013]AOZ76153.1 transcriptional regulator [Clostridium pasteurianum DSM 525 = ATCC 6013]AOZ79949.1 transcriptional regulator [Clostridium pasteurianum]ELP60240.1 glucitol operon activator [Clostridium pasteurianum DSM 525 = ATCC 6013]
MWLIFVAVVAAWIGQMILGIYQIKYFNRYFKEMRKLGKVVIGKNKGKVRAGVIVLMAIDENSNIIKAKKMQGISVFARMRSLKIIENMNLLKIDISNLKGMDKWTIKAVDNGIESYKNYLLEGEN